MILLTVRLQVAANHQAVLVWRWIITTIVPLLVRQLMLADVVQPLLSARMIGRLWIRGVADIYLRAVAVCIRAETRSARAVVCAARHAPMTHGALPLPVDILPAVVDQDGPRVPVTTEYLLLQ